MHALLLLIILIGIIALVSWDIVNDDDAASPKSS
jgi:hypothetical protein